MKIIDPAGFHHTLEKRGNEWYGYENIAHCFEPSQRRAIIEQILLALELQRPTLPLGFTYAL